jgi:signal transduction histidine kinase
MGYEITVRIIRDDGEVRWLHKLTEAVLDDYGRIIQTLGVVTDITDETLAEDQLRHAQKMDAVGQLTGGVAHDFNNLLAIMIGNAELLKESAGDDEEANYSIEAIKAAVERGASLTNRLLAFSRKQILSPATTDVTALVDGLLDMLQRTLGETIELRVDGAPALWAATIDPHQFENALVNLALNARDAMPRGGTLTIATANVTLDETYAEQYQEVTPGDYVEVSVSDSGTGMPPEILEKVFEPFFTTKEVGKGSGLGLSMVFGFAKQSNGHITIHSEVGRHTTVKLYMPRSEEDLIKEGPKDDTRVIAGGSERILVVEDDEHVREVPVRLLRKHGYAVVEAMDSKEAIQHLEDGQRCDLLFTDVVLPGGMSGIEIAEKSKSLHPGIKILLTSGYAEHIIAEGINRDLGATLLRKPYLPAKLLVQVRDILDSGDD